MITSMPTKTMLEKWRQVFERYGYELSPNRISGKELVNYLETHYILTEINDEKALDAVRENVMMNDIYKEKLPVDTLPVPRAFYLENSGNGKKFYRLENMDSTDLWGERIMHIFVGIDVSTGFFTVEGSTMLYDELNAIRGLDEKDLQNYVIVAEYIAALERFNMLDKVLGR